MLGQRQRTEGGRQGRILVRLREGGHALEAPLQRQMPSAQLGGPALSIVDFNQQAHSQPAPMVLDQRPCHLIEHTLRFARGAHPARPLRVREYDHGVVADLAGHGGEVALEEVRGGDAKGRRHVPGHLLRGPAGAVDVGRGRMAGNDLAQQRRSAAARASPDPQPGAGVARPVDPPQRTVQR
ncbi:hypothetical protein [Streptomyces sp. uw30]|uniref:hypothetical protein n=1 Tax=Streptomyces sp. uw30 TaxID=1828179 RepID=UPI001650D5CC